MSLETFSQLISPLSNVLLGLVFAVGYYIVTGLYREIAREMREERVSQATVCRS